MLAAIQDWFPGARQYNGLLRWETEHRAFQVTWSDRHVRVECSGMEGEDMNRFIDIAEEFGCRLYDPQTRTRYDTSEECLPESESSSGLSSRSF
jgi:hypothetical protein